MSWKLIKSSADLFEASRNLRRPFLPFRSHTQTFLCEGRLAVSDEEHEWNWPLSSRLGSGFWNVWRLEAGVDLQKLCLAIQHLCDFTIVVDNYVEGREAHRLPAELTDQRNYAQHSLMSLLSGAELRARGFEAVDPQYDSCRLACIAYSFLVIFPFPPMVGLFDRVALSLQKRLLEIENNESTIDNLRTHLQMWVLMMGSIISIGLPIYSWYIRQLSLVVTRTGIRTWPEMTDILQKFLWHPTTNARDGAEIWKDVQGLGSR
jgi:hypothetical protein